MENKINIYELLKDCPKGMELDCAMFEDVFFDEITNNEIFPICIKRIDGHPVILTKHGGYANCPSSKCVIFPKGKTTWEGFVPPLKLKNGDVIYVKDAYGQEWCSILSNYEDCKLYTYIDFCINNNTFYPNKQNILCEHKDIIEYRRATEKEKQILFDAIKAKGYKWNPETKTLEKLIEPKFKVGDKVTDKNKFIYRITEITDKGYKLHDLKTTFITFEEADLYFVKVVDIFDITTLKPFDKVLTRDNDSQKWGAELFSFYDNENEDYHFQLVGIVNARYCIPYEGNEYLLGTTEDCDEYYKTWE